jgi:hypothetical protein
MNHGAPFPDGCSDRQWMSIDLLSRGRGVWTKKKLAR